MKKVPLFALVFSLWLIAAVPTQAADATRNTDMKMVINPPARPSLLLPTLGQVVYTGSPIAIKLALPEGLDVTEYLMQVEKKDSSGK